MAMLQLSLDLWQWAAHGTPRRVPAVTEEEINSPLFVASQGHGKEGAEVLVTHVHIHWV